ncbi:MAG: dipeptide/oligopeptide/nickel ABC transporter ATP-binding protein [Pelagibacterium sp. SCN 63-23]|nr:MAG: dipeptide/oligopeptide/nickel ABC transporter ATP-binding protein [Pelagibacterium sp. SCN 63-23]
MASETTEAPLLEISGLKTYFGSGNPIRAVDGVDLTIRDGETVCVVGESGCGKSMLARSILRIVSRPGKVVGGSMNFRKADGSVVDLAQLDPTGEAIRMVRGNEIAMIFQEPMTSLGPVQTIGSQIIDAIRLHRKCGKKEARDRAIEILRRVGMPRPEERLNAYPFQLSGGMRQRAMIALALSCNPRLLIADEPTTALDVTTQAVILDLIKELQAESGMAVLFITHDLGVVAEIADNVAVMYLGRVVERSDVDGIFHDPKHPYTRGLLRSIPRLGIHVGEDLDTIEGMVPNPLNRPAGCSFHPRCREAIEGLCNRIDPTRTRLADGSEVRCLLHENHTAEARFVGELL